MILDDKYKNDPGISNSMIKDFRRKGVKYFYDNHIDPERKAREFSTESTIIGDIVDLWLTQPKTYDIFFYDSAGVKVSKDMDECIHLTRDKVIKHLLDVVKLPLDHLYEHQMMKDPDAVHPFWVAAARELDFYSNYKDEEKLAAKLVKDGGNVYRDLTVANGRTIVDFTTKEVARKTRELLENNERTGKLLSKKSNPKKGIEIWKQKMVTVEINGIRVKILLDFAEVNHTEKWVKPADIKTSFSHAQFWINYKELLYGQQGSFYSAVLQVLFPEYTIYPFAFIVGPTDSEEEPLIYRMSPTELKLQRYGAVLRSGAYHAGWQTELDNIKWHMETQNWRYPKEYYDNGVIMIDSFKSDSIASMEEGVGESDDF